MEGNHRKSEGSLQTERVFEDVAVIDLVNVSQEPAGNANGRNKNNYPKIEDSAQIKTPFDITAKLDLLTVSEEASGSGSGNGNTGSENNKKDGSAEENDVISRKVSWLNDVSVQSDASATTKKESITSNGKKSQDAPIYTSPLSWEEARRRIRGILEQYMKTRPPGFLHTPGCTDLETSATSWFWALDLDLWVSALPASVALLILACISYSKRAGGDTSSRINARASLNIYKSQIAASVVFLVGSLLSILLVRRRRWSCRKDGDVSKRYTILKFLLKLNQMDEDAEKLHASSPIHLDDMSHQTHECIPLSGTSLTDIYPVYRRSSTQEETRSWHRVPTLLLTKGDYISLQVGDIAPAKCRKMSLSCKGGVMSSASIAAGERVSLELLGEDHYSAFASIPKGKSSVLPNSRDLLSLCNRMSIFVLEETPLEDFLYLSQIEKRPPQLHRQMMAVRKALYVLAVGVFVLTTLIIFARPNISDRDMSILLPLPFIAALGILPVTTPIGAFILEVFGTARILVAVHPHVLSQQLSNSAKADPSKGNMLFFRYVLAIAASRLSLQDSAREFRTFLKQNIRIFPRNPDAANFLQEDETEIPHPGLMHVPPASSYLLEKLGVVTAFAMVDDELACEPHSTPQQLLIPSGKGLKLLDLCPVGGYESDDKSDSDESEGQRTRTRSFNDDSDDSESDEEQKYQHISIPKRKLKALRKGLKKRNAKRKSGDASSDTSEGKLDENEVQFEDPLWWQHLPSLKCVGLASVLVDDVGLSERDRSHALQISNERDTTTSRACKELELAERALVSHVCVEQKRSQLHSLAQCIGFSCDKNSLERRTFSEVMRLHCVSTEILRERLAIDTHALGLEESRRWDMLRSDSTSIIVQDRRSKAYQLLTVGDARVVAGFCQEAWQGESSTILPFSPSDKKSILDTSDNWRLGDLDVAAFSYSPVPHTWEQRLLGTGKRLSQRVYLIDNATIPDSPHSATTSEDWSLVKNQIFLGVLGSLVTPRKEIENILEVFSEAGVRFVYFSPRNMRRTKELALQMGIDVAWNCAISLRPLDEGEDDPHRMTSTYADWDVNAKLPHGIDAVRQHLEEVDNVPLLVSLFTDVTKDSTQEMLKTFQEYSDTVMVMGLSHLPRNAGIFASVDLAVGTDVLSESLDMCSESVFKPNADKLLPCEVAFVSSISSHSCLFNLKGAASTSHMPFIIAQGRSALNAATSAGTFVITGCLSFSLYVLLCVCTPATTVPYIPPVGSVLYLQVVLPWIGIVIAMSDPDGQSMQRVPPKNDKAIVFGRKEGKRFYLNAVLKALPPALLPQLLYLIAFGELMSAFEPELVASSCTSSSWVQLIRCDALWEYSGPARTSASSLVLAEMVLCVLASSSSFIYRSIPVWEEQPWKGNHAWLYSLALGILFVTIFLVVTLEDGTFTSLPWYFSVLALLMPLMCISFNEAVKFYDSKLEKRAVMLRRLQFETRLGMWSPK